MRSDVVTQTLLDALNEATVPDVYEEQWLRARSRLLQRLRPASF